MNRFRRKDTAYLCACGCGDYAKPGNRFIYNHHARGDNNPMKRPEIVLKFKNKDFHIIPPDSEAPLCGCGCGQKVTWHKENNTWRKFILGHNLRVNNPMDSPEIVAKLRGENHPSKTTEARKRVSEQQLAKGSDHPFRSQEFRDAQSDRMAGVCGPESRNWKGGIAAEPYCDIWLDEEYKQSIRDRDDNECQNPHCKGNCNYLTLHVHHIDGDKKNCHPWNLITLCNGCNHRAEGNKDISREWWQELYQGIMAEKYNYQYKEAA